MKTPTALGVLLALAALTLGCSFQTGATPHVGKSRVIVSAPRAYTAHAKPLSRSLAPHSQSRFTPARDLAAATDITAITYRVLDSAGHEVDRGPIDKDYPYLTLTTLYPNESYRIIVDVAITASAPGHSVGVTRYGDQADFTVDPYYDTYVDLYVHPTSSLVFDPMGVSGTTVKAFDPATKGWASIPSLADGSLTADPADKFFFGPDAKLYYFNKGKNAIYQWRDVSKGLSLTNDRVVLGTDGPTWGGSVGTVDIAAVCADPTAPSMLWVVGFDTGAAADSGWQFYQIDLSSGTAQPGPATSGRVLDITYDLQDGLDSFANLASQIVPTGIAVDSTYYDVYISYRTVDDNGAIQSGLVQYYTSDISLDSGTTWAPQEAAYPGDYSVVSARTFVDKTSSIFTDVVWEGGKAWVLKSPNTTLGKAGVQNQGTADLVALDEWMEDYNFVTPHSAYTAVPAVTTATTKLVLPNRFTGPFQGSVLYLSQTNFNGGTTGVLSAVNLDDATVKSY